MALLTIKNKGPTSLDRSAERPKRVTLKIDYGTCGENIRKGACVALDGTKLVNASSMLFDTKCVGVAMTEGFTGDRISYMTSGRMMAHQYCFGTNYRIDGKIYVGVGGLPIDHPPELGYKQQIGFIDGRNEFIVKIFDKS